jgi:hypothetical protein
MIDHQYRLPDCNYNLSLKLRYLSADYTDLRRFLMEIIRNGFALFWVQPEGLFLENKAD